MKVAVVERDKFGGTCVNNGCTPTKAMVASAYAARTARRAADYGVVLDSSPRVDMKRVKERKDQIVRKSTEGVEKWMRGLKGATVLPGHARFVDESRVQVGSEVISAGEDLRERRRQALGTEDAGHRRRCLPRQRKHDGARLRAAAPGGHRRQLTSAWNSPR
jgi:pyruvate/2-oxoglutarate dehydrogenase complex dihydrolipoamide dehydrogenase (E3) component